MDTNDPMVLVYTRNAFRRLNYLTFAIYSLSIVIIIILVSVLVYLIKNPTRPLFFATDNVGRLLHFVPVNMPNMTHDAVVAWTSKAVEAAFSMDYVNYAAQLLDAEKYFTNDGWSNFMSALTASNNLAALKDRQIIAEAKVVGPPLVMAEGMFQNIRAWKFTFPVIMTYSLPPYDYAHQFSNTLRVSVFVLRQQPLQGYQGLGVMQMIATSAPVSNNGPQQLAMPQQTTP